MQQLNYENYRPALNWKRPMVLLIDGDEKRQFGRAARMRGCGVVVDCANDGASAYALWRPEAYRLVLIEFNGAGEAVREFCTHVQASSPLQKIGFYRAVSPFLSKSEMAGTPVEETLAPIAPVEPAKPISRVLSPGRFMEAAQQIAVLRSRAGRSRQIKHSAPAAAPPRESPNVESAASLAARILSGN
jgi:CheY-like chemotaxis protein